MLQVKMVSNKAFNNSKTFNKKEYLIMTDYHLSAEDVGPQRYCKKCGSMISSFEPVVDKVEVYYWDFKKNISSIEKSPKAYKESELKGWKCYSCDTIFDDEEVSYESTVNIVISREKYNNCIKEMNFKDMLKNNIFNEEEILDINNRRHIRDNQTHKKISYDKVLDQIDQEKAILINAILSENKDDKGKETDDNISSKSKFTDIKDPKIINALGCRSEDKGWNHGSLYQSIRFSKKIALNNLTILINKLAKEVEEIRNTPYEDNDIDRLHTEVNLSRLRVLGGELVYLRELLITVDDDGEFRNLLNNNVPFRNIRVRREKDGAVTYIKVVNKHKVIDKFMTDRSKFMNRGI